MRNRIGEKRRKALIEDLVRSERDVLAIGEGFGLSPDDMAYWISQPENARTLRGLCQLADTQTQVLMSRYRLLAATRLIGLATTPGEAKEDVARRACVDVLKVELKGAVPDTEETPQRELEGFGEEEDLMVMLQGVFDGDD